MLPFPCPCYTALELDGSFRGLASLSFSYLSSCAWKHHLWNWFWFRPGECKTCDWYLHLCVSGWSLETLEGPWSLIPLSLRRQLLLAHQWTWQLFIHHLINLFYCSCRMYCAEFVFRSLCGENKGLWEGSSACWAPDPSMHMTLSQENVC